MFPSVCGLASSKTLILYIGLATLEETGNNVPMPLISQLVSQLVSQLIQLQWNSSPCENCVGVAVRRTMYQRKVDVDMLNAVKNVLADVSPSSLSPSSEQDSQLSQLVSSVS